MKEFFSLPDTEELVRQYADDVLRVCNFYLGKRCLAEDAFQDVFVKVIRKRSTFDGKCPPKYWILTIAKNVCKDYLKSSWSTRIGSFDEFAEETSGDDGSGNEKKYRPLLAEERNQEDVFFDSLEPVGPLWDAICRLPDNTKDVVLLRYYCQMDNAAVAKACNVTESTVRSRLFRARKKLERFDTSAAEERGELYERSV
ncbi:MAG: sigma-70 family RNA polymerase sigma factor [Clostridiales bacterium]|nr:sigma-70 family RNA polymerase sigma factor [Clostridiales bacterium]